MFKHLDYSRGWDDYWRDHPEGYSPQEQMINWAGQLNAMIDFFNKYFDVDLTEYATDVMEGWYFDGRLEDIINEVLFTSKADKTTVNALLAENVEIAKRLNQNDYVGLIKSNTEYDKVKFKKINDNKFVFVAHNSKKAVAYHMVKDVDGEHFRLSLSQLSNVVDKEINKYSAVLADVTGNWNTTNAENWFTSDVGDTFQASVVGDTLYLGHYADDRGGIWEIVIDGDEKNKVIVSTYSDTAISFKKSLIADGLEYKNHSIVGTFKGADPLNTPTDTARGWLKTGGTPSNQFGTLFGHEAEFIEPYADVLEENVVVDGALSLKVGSSAVNWMPEHNQTGTVFTLNTNQHPLQLFVDGNSINADDFETGKWYWCNFVTVFQNLEVRLPDVTYPVAQLKRSHTLNKDGVMSYSASVYFLQDTTVHAGYPLMLSANEDIFSIFVTGLGNTFTSKNDDTYTNAEEEENINVNVALLSGTNRHYIVACKMLNPYTTFRIGQENTAVLGENQFLWNREFAPKYYFKSLEMASMQTGETYKWSGQFAIADIYRVRDYI